MSTFKVALWATLWGLLIVFASTLFTGCTLQKPTMKDGPDVKVISGINSHGSGFVLANGVIITAGHVAGNDSGEYQIKTETGRILQAKMMWKNKTFDIAALKITGEEDAIKPAKMDCAEPQIGTAIFANGNPYDMETITTTGFIASSPARKIGPWFKALIADLTLGPGMSGGPVYNQKTGFVVAVSVGQRITNSAPTGFSVVVPASVVCTLLGR